MHYEVVLYGFLYDILEKYVVSSVCILLQFCGSIWYSKIRSILYF